MFLIFTILFLENTEKEITKTEEEMNKFINEEVGQSSERHSYYIAEIGRETKNENLTTEESTKYLMQILLNNKNNPTMYLNDLI